MKTISSFLFFILILSNATYTNAQRFVHKRLQKVENTHPEKLEKVAERYTKILPKRPVAYYFLAKSHFLKFAESTTESKQYKYIKSTITNATKAQKLDLEEELIGTNDWVDFKEQLKHDAYFYLDEVCLSHKISRLSDKYYRFISNGEVDYMSKKRLNIQFPAEEKIDTLHYGMPTGTEVIPVKFYEEEVRLLAAINKGRQEKGLNTVALDSSLSAACRYHAYDMGSQNYSGHMGYDTTTEGRKYFANNTFDRIGKFYNETKLLGENISYYNKSYLGAYNGWYNSPGHNRNMFNPDIRIIGLGLVYVPGSEYEYYWVFCSAE